MKYKRMSVHIFILAVLIAGIIALVGHTGVMTREKPRPQAVLNPNSALPELVWSGEKPQLPEITVFEYAAQPKPPIDIKELIARIWEGQAYEVYDHGEFGRLYRLPLYQSKYGKFREELETFDKGFIYRWEINENYPERREMNISPDQAYEETIKYARRFLGDTQYTEYPVPFRMTVDEDGKQIKHFYEFSWEHRINAIPVYSEGLHLRVIPEGIPDLWLSWSTFTPVDTQPKYKSLTFDEALFSLNYVRSFVDPQKCSDHGKGDSLVSARVVYSNVLSDDPVVYRPVWEFILSRSNKSHHFPILVDSMTGNVWEQPRRYRRVLS